MFLKLKNITFQSITGKIYDFVTPLLIYLYDGLPFLYNDIYILVVGGAMYYLFFIMIYISSGWSYVLPLLYCHIY